MGADIYQRTLISGITQVVIGVLCILFGISYYTLSTSMEMLPKFISMIFSFSLWGAVWILVTGIIGTITIGQKRSGTQPCMCCNNGVQEGYAMRGNGCASFRCMIGVYMGFSITATVIAAIMIMGYAMNLAWYGHDFKYAFVTISLFMLIFGIGAFVVTIWAAICCCRILCGGQNPQMAAPVGPVVYTQTQGPPAVYVVAQGPDGTPVAIPAGPMTEPGGTLVNNPDETAAVPPHYNFDAQGQQTTENPVNVAL